MTDVLFVVSPRDLILLGILVLVVLGAAVLKIEAWWGRRRLRKLGEERLRRQQIRHMTHGLIKRDVQ